MPGYESTNTAFSKRTQEAFTLIELMLVVALVAVLLALAVPSYLDYTVRAKVIECINNAAVVKLQISEFRESMGFWPPDPDTAGIAGSMVSKHCDGFTNYVAATGSYQVDVDEVEIGAGIATLQPQLTPTDNGGSSIDWRCSRGTTGAAELKYLPSTCRGT